MNTKLNSSNQAKTYLLNNPIITKKPILSNDNKIILKSIIVPRRTFFKKPIENRLLKILV